MFKKKRKTAQCSFRSLFHHFSHLSSCWSWCSTNPRKYWTQTQSLPPSSKELPDCYSSLHLFQSQWQGRRESTYQIQQIIGGKGLTEEKGMRNFKEWLPFSTDTFSVYFATTFSSSPRDPRSSKLSCFDQKALLSAAHLGARSQPHYTELSFKVGTLTCAQWIRRAKIDISAHLDRRCPVCAAPQVGSLGQDWMHSSPAICWGGVGSIALAVPKHRL